MKDLIKNIIKTPKFIIKSFISIIIMILTIIYIYKYGFDKHINWNFKINFYYIFLSILCYCTQHFSRAFVAYKIIGSDKISFYKTFFLVSIQYFLIFVFSFGIGELSLVYLLNRYVKLSIKRSLAIMIFLQFIETAAIICYIGPSLYLSESLFFNNILSNILKKVVIAGTFTFFILIFISLLLKNWNKYKNKFLYLKDLNNIFSMNIICRSFFIMLIGWVFPFLSIMLTFKALGYNILFYQGVLGSAVAYSSFLLILKPPLSIGWFYLGWVKSFELLKVPIELSQQSGIIEYIIMTSIVIIFGITGFIIFFKKSTK